MIYPPSFALTLQFAKDDGAYRLDVSLRLGRITLRSAVRWAIGEEALPDRCDT